MTTEAPVITLDRVDRGVQVALVGVLLTVAASAFFLGAIPLIEIAHTWAGLPRGTALLLPVVLDAGAVAAALASIVRRQRGQRAGLEHALLALTVVVSVAAQVVHGWSIGDGVWTASTVIVAAALGSAPVIVLLSSHAAIRTLSQPAPKRAARRPRAKTVATPAVASSAATPAPKPAPRPAPAKPAAAPATKRPVPPADLPARLDGEQDVDYAMRLHVEHGASQRNAATAAGTSRSKLETRLKQQASQQPQLAA